MASSLVAAPHCGSKVPCAPWPAPRALPGVPLSSSQPSCARSPGALGTSFPQPLLISAHKGSDFWG